jgi:hypothetical protein
MMGFDALNQSYHFRPDAVRRSALG